MNHLIGDTMTAACSDHRKQISKALRHHLEQVSAHGGSLHHVHHSNQHLMLIAAVNLPSALLPSIEKIPINKGLAGLAWASRSVVSSCDLQTDPKVGEMAKPLPFKSSYALPIIVNESVIAVLGVAFSREIVLTPEMQQTLSVLPARLKP